MRTRLSHPGPGPALAVTLAAALVGCSSSSPRTPAQNSPPAPAAVRDGIGSDSDAQSMVSSLFANWDPFVDPEGWPVLYEWSIGTSPGKGDVLDWTDVAGATRASTGPDVDLPVDCRLYVSVRARDVAGAYSEVSSSDGIRLGVPEAPWVPPGLGTTTGDPDTPPRDQGRPQPPGRQVAVERFDTTWTFAEPAVCGRFVNGDWWVIGPVEIVSITPACRIEFGRVRNGSMINPDPTRTKQGYDSAMFGEDAAAGFDAAANVASELGPQSPLRLQPGSSLVSTTSHAEPGAMPQLETCAILTCLDAPPASDAFRPPYCGTDKTCRWRASRLQLSRFASLPPVQATPRARDLIGRFERAWLDHIPGWNGRYLHPSQNLPDYGRDMADLIGQAGLLLQLDGPIEEKQALAIALVQIGIDNYGIVKNGGRFVADGGSGAGRKFPILLAGTLLQDEALTNCARETKLAFAEDVQTFFVEETAPGVWNHGHGGYGASDVGLAEWGLRHAEDPSLDRKAWTADSYRRCCSANAWSGFVLASRIMAMRESWGHDALFEYVDRYMQIEEHGSWTRAWSPFAERMWDRYRVQF
ncbi:MAG: hypothetical protein KDC98_09635 [Planctomycetes bacterium]|nr:hypothetical protein [Planctomycetota bacterium]